jgi:PAS domain S-box-containing protein
MWRLPELKDLNKGSVIISETNPSGIILHANDAFCALSRYSREELIGSGHNIVRHPSMPKELFQHLWSTIKGGDVFRGVIKNLAKDGSDYWVNCTMMPVFENNKIVRYVSARHLIEDQNVADDLFSKQLTKYGLQKA